MQNGHLFPEDQEYLDGMKEIVKFTCYSCNCHFYMENPIFGVKLNQEYGYNIAEELLIESKKIIKQSDEDLKELIKLYEDKIKQT